MKILVVGSGGREHAIAWKLSQSNLVEKIFCAPGNGGTALEDKCENLNITEIDALITFVKNNDIYMTVVGPEEPLTKGIYDRFKEEGLKIFGPSKKAAMLEGSKVFSKNFMEKYGVKTAKYRNFDNYNEALKYVEHCEYPLVIKADGLAAGKGVVICKSLEEAKDALENFMLKDIFKGSGKNIVVEEFLEGVEASILSITDGSTIIPFLSAKDHKQVLDGDKGPNTGGMGVISPNPYVTEDVLKAFEEDILKPTLKGIKDEDMDYKGIIFFGLMISKKGVYLLEYNVRMGDPETQAVLSLMDSDFAEVIDKTLSGEIKKEDIKWKNSYSTCVVAASSGYPGSYQKGFEINIDKAIKGKVFIAGGELRDEILRTTGGRVLSLVTLGNTLEEARKLCYEEIKNISFENIYYRRDIGLIK